MRMPPVSCLILAVGLLPAGGCASSFPKALFSIKVDGSNPGGRNISADKRRTRGPGLLSGNKDGFVILGGDLESGSKNAHKPAKIRR